MSIGVADNYLLPIMQELLNYQWRTFNNKQLDNNRDLFDGNRKGNHHVNPLFSKLRVLKRNFSILSFMEAQISQVYCTEMEDAKTIWLALKTILKPLLNMIEWKLILFYKVESV